MSASSSTTKKKSKTTPKSRRSRTPSEEVEYALALIRERCFENEVFAWDAEVSVAFQDSLKERRTRLSPWITTQLRSAQDLSPISPDLRRNRVDHSVAFGIGGFLYTAVQLRVAQHRVPDFVEPYASTLRHHLSSSSASSSRRHEHFSFLNGTSGPHALLAVSLSQRCADLLAQNGKDDDAELAERQSLSDSLLQHLLAVISVAELALAQPEVPSELYYGRAGVLFALLVIAHHLDQSALVSSSAALAASLQRIEELRGELVSRIFAVGREYSTRHGSASPLMYQWHHSEYLGGVHGLTGILLVLLDPLLLPLWWDRERDRADVLACVAFLDTQVQACTGNLFTRPDSNHAYLLQWCHGSSPLVMLHARLFELTGEAHHLTRAERGADAVWKYGLLRKGVGLCHGIAGNGYVFLRLYHVTRDISYLYRAHRFHDQCMARIDELRLIPDDPASLANGLLGCLCFSINLLVADVDADTSILMDPFFFA